MKRLASLLATLLLVAGVHAQVDVTDTYLTNAGFDTESDFVSSIVYTYASDANANGGVSSCQSVTGWTADGSGDAKAGGAFRLGSGYGLSGSGYVVPPTDAFGNNDGGVLGLAGCWGNAVGYYQTVTLPAGLYRVSAMVYNSGTNSIANYSGTIGFVENGGTAHYAETDLYAGEWTECVVYLSLSAAKKGRIHLGYTCANVGSAATPKLFVDYVKIEQCPASMGFTFTDRTSSIKNADWGGSQLPSAIEGITGREAFQWANTLPMGERLGQTLTGLPNGVYSLTMYVGVSSTSGRDNTSFVVTDGSTGYASFHANNASQGVPAYNRTEMSKFDRIQLDNVYVTDGTLKMYFSQDGHGPNWLVVYAKQLLHVGNLPDTEYTVGDMNGDGMVSAADITALADVVQGKTKARIAGQADVDNDGTLSEADVTALVDVVLGKAEARIVDRSYENYTVSATVYARQSASENAAGAGYVLNSAVAGLTGKDVASAVDIRDYLTTLNITTSLSDVASVSIYANGREKIAGPMTVMRDDARRKLSYQYGASGTYGGNQESSVVNVVGQTSGTYVAYLRPVELTDGVKVTIRTGDGKFYSQDFTGIVTGKANNLTFTQGTAQNLWMATIPGDINFSMISTPGAHDAATSSVTSYESMSRCQSEDIAGLLANGVRAFDLRPGYHYTTTITEDNLFIYHGQVNTNILYRDAMRTLADFLAANPTEAIAIIMVKENCKPTLDLLGRWSDRSSEMWSVVNAVHSTYGSYMKVLDHSYYTLDDFRGKMCYINRTGTDCTNTTRITNWPDDGSVTNYSCAIGGTCSANVEDEYNDGTSDKQTAVSNMLGYASNNTDRSRFHYTYTSIANSPASYASTMNPATVAIIGNLAGPLGYVYGDYMGSSSNGGADLLRAIVEQNYKYVFQGRSR